MPQNEMAGSISFSQKKYLSTLVDEREGHDAPWFKDLKEGRTDYDDLSAAEASSYIEALTGNKKSGSESTASDDSDDDEKKRAPGPATAKQLELLRKLGDEKALVSDGLIDAEHLYSRLNASTASKLIETLRYIPRLEAAQ